MTASFASLLDRLVFGRAYQGVAHALASFGALAMPSCCVVCGSWDTSLCAECLARFRSATARPFDAEAGAESLPDVDRTEWGPGRTRTTAVANRPGATATVDGPLPVVAAGRYGGAVSVVLLAYKNHGHVDLAAPVAAALAGALHGAGHRFRDAGPAAGPAAVRPVLLVPVPTRAASRRRRGYDPLMLLLSRLGRRGRLPAGMLLAPMVRQLPLPARLAAACARGGAAAAVRTAVATVLPGSRGGQKGLGRRRRRANVLRSMGPSRRMRHALAGRDCVIVDDVLTTGATIAEVHRVLVANGAQVLGAVVIAATASPAAARDRNSREPPVRPEHPPGSRADYRKFLEWQGMNKGQG